MESQADKIVEKRSVSTFPSSISIVKLAELRWVIYRLYASLYLYPEHNRLVELQDAASVLLADDIGLGYPFSAALVSLLRQLAEIDLENERPIVNEYNRLFLIRPKAPPHETVYTDAEGQLRGMLTARLEEVYMQAELALSPVLNELPDHISVELEFLSYLCMKEAEARQSKNDVEANRFLALQESFLVQHLARWFPKFAQRIKAAEPRSLYQFLLPAVYSFLRCELDLFELGN